MLKNTLLGMSLLLAVSACSTADIYTNAAIDAGVQAKDTEANLLVNALCAMGIGALARMPSSDTIEGVLQICANNGISLEDMEDAKGEDNE